MLSLIMTRKGVNVKQSGRLMTGTAHLKGTMAAMTCVNPFTIFGFSAA